ncbi:MAG: helix-turn-helix domain-containing protein [Dysgonamonadaceae bacterium]|jgi:hypothetical protein|nr:helix-turn-helix domain-containing protein [Dysgonamonadaceae bacterium]
MKNNTIDIVEKDLQRFISDLIAIVKNPYIEMSYLTTTSDIKTCIEDYALRNNLSEANILDLYSKIAQRVRELTTLIYNASYEAVEDSFKKKEQEMTQKLSSSKKLFYTVKEVVAMSNIFNMKTENTVIKKLNPEGNGEIKAKKINGQWQIPRQSLIDYVEHDKF